MTIESYNDAKNKLLSGNYSFERFFNLNNYILEYAYCKLLSGNIDYAKTEFKKVESFDTRGDWGVKLINLIKLENFISPSFFQLRNFLEIDLNLLIQAGQAEFVENILSYADLFYKINPESYKFIARVMLNNDFTDVALYYLMKAKEKFYYDPEMHFMLANCYLKMNNSTLAKKSLHNCLNILPKYTPAKKLLEKLN